MLLFNGKVETFFNVTWINNASPKPTSMELTPRGMQQVNNVKLLEVRSKRRSDAIDATQEPASIFVSGERAFKRRREPSVEATDFTAVSARREYLTEVRIPVRAQPPTRRASAPRAPSGESPESPETLSNEALTPSTASEDSASGEKPTTRSMTGRKPSKREPPRRHEILRAHLDLTPDPLALLAKANPSESYEPQSHKEAIANAYRKMQWELSMQEEVDFLVTNDTWTLVDLPSNAYTLGGKWVYKIKRGSQGEIARYKARWVVRGFGQREGIDFNETFAFVVVKPMSYKAMFASAAALDRE